MTVTVYTLPNCVQCDSTKRMLTRGLIDFTEVDLSQDNEALAKIREWGYTAAPVVEYDNQHWSGFRMERVQGIITAEKKKANQ